MRTNQQIYDDLPPGMVRTSNLAAAIHSIELIIDELENGGYGSVLAVAREELGKFIKNSPDYEAILEERGRPGAWEEAVMDRGMAI